MLELLVVFSSGHSIGFTFTFRFSPKKACSGRISRRYRRPTELSRWKQTLRLRKFRLRLKDSPQGEPVKGWLWRSFLSSFVIILKFRPLVFRSVVSLFSRKRLIQKSACFIMKPSGRDTQPLVPMVPQHHLLLFCPKGVRAWA